MRKFSGNVEIHWCNYEPYAGECVRYVEPIGDQYFIMDFQRMDINFYDNDVVFDWNVYMAIVDEVTDETFYSVDETKTTGKIPFETYPMAIRALNELIKYMETKYRDEADEFFEFGHLYHHLYVWNAKGRRLKIYDRILKRLGWEECKWDNEHSYRKVVCG